VENPLAWWHHVYTISAYMWRHCVSGFEKLALFDLLFLCFFLQILPQQKTFSKILSMCIIRILDATFVPNLTFLGLLSPEILFGEKTVTQPPTETPRSFRHLCTSVIHTEELHLQILFICTKSCTS